MSGPTRAPLSGTPADSLVVLLHGVGADGYDLLDLTDTLAEALPRTEFSAPHAPFPCDLAPYGRQWFSLQDRNPARLLVGVQSVTPILTGFLEAERRRLGLPWQRLALFGFSQGCMTALHVAPRLPGAVAAVCGFSGAMVAGERLVEEAVHRPPVLLEHGTDDAVVEAEFTRQAAATLRAAGFPVESRLVPGLGHWIEADGVRRAGEFLAAALPEWAEHQGV